METLRELMAQRLLRWFYLLKEGLMSYAFTRLVGLVVLSCALTAPCTAAFYPLADIRVAVADFLQSQSQNSAQKVQIEVGQLDPRLHLAPCDQSLSLALPPGAPSPPPPPPSTPGHAGPGGAGKRAAFA
jgi:hypothetical protein